MTRGLSGLLQATSAWGSREKELSWLPDSPASRLYAARDMMTVRGDTRAGLGSRTHCVDWLGRCAEEDDGEEEEELE